LKLFLHNDNKVIIENINPITPKVQLDEIDGLYEELLKHLSSEVKIPKDVLSSFKIKNELNQDIWVEDKLNPVVRKKLYKIAIDFFQSFEFPNDIKIKDIIFTGSLANYNWSKYSDIDLHIVLDFKDFNGEEKFMEDFFYAYKNIWNREHDITVYGYPVELYVQNLNDKLVATAVYSIVNDEWIKKPKKEVFKLDIDLIKNKAEKFIRELKTISKLYDRKEYKSVIDNVDNVKKKIKNLRQSGLDKGGEFSIENIIFKVLRRTSFMDQLDSFKAKAYDNMMSIEEVLDEIVKLPYDEKPEMSIGSSGKYQSTTPLSKTISNKAYEYLKYKIAKSHKLALVLKNNSELYNYFINPNIGVGYYKVVITNAGLVQVQHTTATGSMGSPDFHVQTDVGYHKSLTNEPFVCYVRAGFGPSDALGKSPADDAANKALYIFGNEILEKFGDNIGYNDGKSAEISKEKMTDKQALHKQKKDLEFKLGRRISDSEWENFKDTGMEPKSKEKISLSSDKVAEFEKRQAELRAKYANKKK
jgi:predicted nucleotidyltransferase